MIVYKIKLIYNKKDFSAKLNIKKNGNFQKLFRNIINFLFCWTIPNPTPLIYDQNKQIVYNKQDKNLLVEAIRINPKINKKVINQIIIKNINFIDIRKDTHKTMDGTYIDFIIQNLSNGSIKILSWDCHSEFCITLESFPLYFIQQDIYN